MLTLLKLVAAGTIAFGVLNPGSSPRGEDCQCKAKAESAVSQSVPHAEDCECKAKT